MTICFRKWELTGVGVELLVDVDEDTRVGCTVCTGELDGGRACCARTAHIHLEARHVEPKAGQNGRQWDKSHSLLSSTNTAGNVESYTIAVSSVQDQHELIAYQ